MTSTSTSSTTKRNQNAHAHGVVRWRGLLVKTTTAIPFLFLLSATTTMAFAGWGPLRPSKIIPSTTSSTTTSTRASTATSLADSSDTSVDATEVNHVEKSDNHFLDSIIDDEDDDDEDYDDCETSSHKMDCVTTKDILSLGSIRSSLIRQEETIIFALIERSQFRRNAIVYRKGGFGSLGVPVGSTSPTSSTHVDGVNAEQGGGGGEEEEEELSFLEYMLVGTEALHCGVRRYTSPEEHAFFPERLPGGPLANLPSLQYPDQLLSSEGGASHLNYNKRLLQRYIDTVVPAITQRGDDEQHGSTVLCDIAVLQAMSRRVHYGKFVAESKYRSDPEGYQKLVDAGDADGVMRLLTNAKVEAQVLRRARLKAATYGTEPLLAEMPPIEISHKTARVAQAAASAVVAALGAIEEEERVHGGFEEKVDPALIESIYRDLIIPMTKDIEVAYLFLRCGKQPPPLYMP